MFAMMVVDWAQGGFCCANGMRVDGHEPEKESQRDFSGEDSHIRRSTMGPRVLSRV